MKRPLTPYRSALLIKMMNCFCRIVDWPKGFSLTPARTTVILIIANLWHAAYRIWTWAKSFFFFYQLFGCPKANKIGSQTLDKCSSEVQTGNLLILSTMSYPTVPLSAKLNKTEWKSEFRLSWMELCSSTNNNALVWQQHLHWTKKLIHIISLKKQILILLWQLSNYFKFKIENTWTKKYD